MSAFQLKICDVLLSFQGGTIAILSVIDRPDFFTGAVFSGPSVTADPNMITPCKVICLYGSHKKAKSDWSKLRAQE